MKSVSSYVSGVLSFGVLCWFISKVGVYHSHCVTRSIEYEQAKRFLKSPTCTDPVLKADLGDFNLCDRSVRILYTHPWIQAIYDTAEDLRWCGHDSCSKYLPKIILIVIIIVVAILLFSGFQIRQDRRFATREFYQLPVKLPLKGPSVHVHED